ncbi:MAG: acetate kinase [Ignavibacteria bacterium]|jgi:acetate kinase|nr:acetate kinase [Ignavibacteria bacterium]
MNILVLNCGSSSLKFQIIDTDSDKIRNNDDRELAKGLIEKVGSQDAMLSFKSTVKSDDPTSTNIYKITKPLADHTEALNCVIDWLNLPSTTIEGVSKLSDIHAIGHRTVHGAEHFKNSVLINEDVIKELEHNVELAPLHNPANILGIKAATAVFGTNTPQVGIFDTAFHSTMPQYAYMYGIPYEYYTNYKIRKYGFHGTSHRYIAMRYRAMQGKTVEETNIISLHLGNGGSITAIKNGKSLDTTMGFTPLEGLLMGTRSGDIDPTILEFIMKKEHKSIEEVVNILNKRSGILGISGISNDMRDIEDGIAEGNTRAILAQDIYCYRIKKYIGSYIAAMNGTDAICFTAGVGENDITVRQRVCEDLEFLGLEFDAEANRNCIRGEETLISKPSSRIKVYVIPTNEELMLARDTYCIVSNNPITE